MDKPVKCTQQVEEKNLKYKSSNSNLVLSVPLSTVCYWSSPFHCTDETVYRIAYVFSFLNFMRYTVWLGEWNIPK